MKIKKPAKPTVFLSHSSTNRRELLGLKRFLDERSGGLIDFFLSSDDDSIAHGTIWPEEVRAALDRMTLMLIFVSLEALKSGWTYFEAGYGLHKLGSAKIYCLPGADKASLPSPFNILQNRNLHSPRDISLLIKQCNEELDASMKEGASQDEFDRIFRKPLMVKLQTGPNFEGLVKNVSVSILGPANSADLFADVCKKRDFAVSRVASYDWRDTFVSTGVRLKIPQFEPEDFLNELPITPRDRELGHVKIQVQFDIWTVWEEGSLYRARTVSIGEIEAYNAKIRLRNEGIGRQNEAKKIKPRECSFELAPTNISVPIQIIDDWQIAASTKKSPRARIEFQPQVEKESRIEAITAKIHGSELSLHPDGSYRWGKDTKLEIKWIGRDQSCDLELESANERPVVISEFRLQELVVLLFDLNIISLATQRSRGRRK